MNNQPETSVQSYQLSNEVNYKSFSPREISIQQKMQNIVNDNEHFFIKNQKSFKRQNLIQNEMLMKKSKAYLEKPMEKNPNIVFPYFSQSRSLPQNQLRQIYFQKQQTKFVEVCSCGNFPYDLRTQYRLNKNQCLKMKVLSQQLAAAIIPYQKKISQYEQIIDKIKKQQEQTIVKSQKSQKILNKKGKRQQKQRKIPYKQSKSNTKKDLNQQIIKNSVKKINRKSMNSNKIIQNLLKTKTNSKQKLLKNISKYSQFSREHTVKSTNKFNVSNLSKQNNFQNIAIKMKNIKSSNQQHIKSIKQSSKRVQRKNNNSKHNYQQPQRYQQSIHITKQPKKLANEKNQPITEKNIKRKKIKVKQKQKMKLSQVQKN